ncbi:MAG: type II toxin-antitoxin system YafQ family toxin [Deltaproteobacteria bacterium]|nr:type II toxin-antitoxin system YafQ family toxin [Deltaproteobacteria bacterium]
MLVPISTTKLKRDWKKAVKRGHDIEALRSVMDRLAKQERLERKYVDHKLSGNYIHRRCCHVEPDLVLIYKPDIENNEIIFERVGTHADLFGM